MSFKYALCCFFHIKFCQLTFVVVKCGELIALVVNKLTYYIIINRNIVALRRIKRANCYILMRHKII